MEKAEANGSFREIKSDLREIKTEQGTLSGAIIRLVESVDRQSESISLHSAAIQNWARIAENVAPISFVKSMFLMNCVTTLVILTGVEGLKMLSKYLIP